MRKEASPEISSEIQQVLSDWRTKTLNTLYKISIGVGIIGLLIVVITDAIPNKGRGSGLAFYTVALAFVTFFAIKQDLNQKLRAWVFLGIIYALAVLALLLISRVTSLISTPNILAAVAA